jgi:hypothetical protein
VEQGVTALNKPAKVLLDLKQLARTTDVIIVLRGDEALIALPDPGGTGVIAARRDNPVFKAWIESGSVIDGRTLEDVAGPALEKARQNKLEAEENTG